MAVARNRASRTVALRPADRRADRPRPVRRRPPRPVRPATAEPNLLASIYEALGNTQGATDLRNGSGDQMIAKILLAAIALAVGVGGIWLLFISVASLVSLLQPTWRDRILPWVFVGPALALLAVFLVYPAAGTILRSFQDNEGQFSLANYAVMADPEFIADPAQQRPLAGRRYRLAASCWDSSSPGCSIASDASRWPRPSSSCHWRSRSSAHRSSGASSTPGSLPACRRSDCSTRSWSPSAVTRSRGCRRARSTSSCEIVILIWLQTGFAMVVLSAAIKGVPGEIIEAARLDGATERQIFLRVIVPMIRGSIITVATTIAIVTLKIFDIVYVTTGGRFDDDVVANRMFHEIFQFFDDGRGAALATLLFVAVLPVMYLNLRNFRRQQAQGMTAPAQPIEARQARVAAWRPAFMRSLPLRLSVLAICFLWTLPTLGLLVTSVRDPALITTSGWWTALFSPFDPPNQWTLSNYETVISSDGMGDAFINSLIVTIPSVAIPITIAAFAAYAFAWIPFRGRGILFTIVVALLVVPIQMSLIPILQIYCRREPVRLVPRHLAGAHGLRPAARDLPALQLHVAVAARPVRVRRHRWRVASPDVHPARPAAVGPGPRRDRHLPVPVGLE